MVTDKGPSIGSYKERDIPGWIDARGGRYVYDRLWDERSGELSQLARDELVIAPGLIYKLHIHGQ
jgi:hypothetical protein